MTFFQVQRRLRTFVATFPWRRTMTPAFVLQLGAWLVLLGALEFFGRVSPIDWLDGVGVVILFALGTMVLVRHRAALEGFWARTGGARLLRLRSSWRLEAGIDLRSSPPLEERVPRRWAGLLGGLFATALLLAWQRGFLPTGLRAFLQSLSGLGYLVYLSVLWSLLLGGTLTCWMGFLSALDGRLKSLPRWGEQRHRTTTAVAATLFLLVTAGALFLPRLTPGIALIVVFVVYASVVLSVAHPLRVTWRYARAGGRPHWGRWALWDVGSVAGIVTLFLTLSLLAQGDRLSGSGSSNTDATAFLGLGFSWTVATFFPCLLWAEAYRLVANRRADPARPLPTRVHLTGAASPTVVEPALDVLAAAGIEACLEPSPRQADQVALSLVPDSHAVPDDPWERRWPLSVAPAQLRDAAVLESIRRRDVIQRRRALLRGLERLFKQAAARRFQRGQGLWVAPHLWYVTHLSRDSDEDDTRPIGLPYRRALTRAARAQAFELMRGMDVDLFFVEDGVGFRRFRRVLACAFEYHDVFGGRRLEDERPFSGIPGVRVLLHEFVLDQPFRSTTYPEPDHEDLGRARILHVYRDRGGEDAEELEPIDFSSLPVPSFLPLLT